MSTPRALGLTALIVLALLIIGGYFANRAKRINDSKHLTESMRQSEKRMEQVRFDAEKDILLLEYKSRDRDLYNELQLCQNHEDLQRVMAAYNARKAAKDAD